MIGKNRLESPQGKAARLETIDHFSPQMLAFVKGLERELHQYPFDVRKCVARTIQHLPFKSLGIDLQKRGTRIFQVLASNGIHRPDGDDLLPLIRRFGRGASMRFQHGQNGTALRIACNIELYFAVMIAQCAAWISIPLGISIAGLQQFDVRFGKRLKRNYVACIAAASDLGCKLAFVGAHIQNQIDVEFSQ